MAEKSIFEEKLIWGTSSKNRIVLKFWTRDSFIKIINVKYPQIEYSDGELEIFGLISGKSVQNNVSIYTCLGAPQDINDLS